MFGISSGHVFKSVTGVVHVAIVRICNLPYDTTRHWRSLMEAKRGYNTVAVSVTIGMRNKDDLQCTVASRKPAIDGISMARDGRSNTV